jgi:cyclohexanone monooxygenase
MGRTEQIPDPGIEFDANALREKDRQERDQRLRPDGSAQYIETTGQFARYFEVDPYV